MRISSPIYIYLITWLALCVPIILNQYPMMVDFVNHLSRQFIRHELDNLEHFQDYFSYQWALLPNLANDLLISPLLNIFDIYTAGKIFLCFMLLLWVMAPVVLQKAVWGEVEYLPLIGTLIAYNSMFYWGFTGNMVTAPIAIMVFAAWVYSQNKNFYFLKSFFIFLPLFFIIYVGHLFAFFLLGFWIVVYETCYWWKKNNQDYKKLIIRALQVGVMFSLGLAHFSYYLMTKGVEHGNTDINWYVSLEIIFASFYPNASDISNMILLFLGFIFFDGLKTKKIFNLECKENFKAPIIIYTVTSVMFPITLLGIYHVVLRVQPIIILLVCGILKADFSVRHSKQLFISIVLILCCIQISHQNNLWSLYNQDVYEFKEATSSLPEGSKVLFVFDQYKSHYIHNNYPSYWHIGSILSIEKQIYTPHIFTGMGSFFQTNPILNKISPPQAPDITLKKFKQGLMNQNNLKGDYKFLRKSYENFDYVVIYGAKEETSSYILEHFDVINFYKNIKIIRSKRY